MNKRECIEKINDLMDDIMIFKQEKYEQINNRIEEMKYREIKEVLSDLKIELAQLQEDLE